MFYAVYGTVIQVRGNAAEGRHMQLGAAAFHADDEFNIGLLFDDVTDAFIILVIDKRSCNVPSGIARNFRQGGALISGFSSYHHNSLLIYLIHYVTKYFSEK